MRRLRRSEAGFTLVEMMITSALLLTVVAIVLPLVAGSLNTFTNTQTRSDAVDNAQLALGQIGRDIVSSNILYVDTSGPAPVIHLQTYRSSAPPTCVEYQVQYPPSPQAQVGVLQRRIKAPGTGSAWPASWTNIMTGIVNSSQPVVPPATAPPDVFSVPSTSRYQSLVVNLWVQIDTRSAATASAPENYTSTFTGPAIPANAAATAAPSSEPC